MLDQSESGSHCKEEVLHTFKITRNSASSSDAVTWNTFFQDIVSGDSLCNKFDPQWVAHYFNLVPDKKKELSKYLRLI